MALLDDMIRRSSNLGKAAQFRNLREPFENSFRCARLNKNTAEIRHLEAVACGLLPQVMAIGI
jgi:hypothetical protein